MAIFRKNTHIWILSILFISNFFIHYMLRVHRVKYQYHSQSPTIVRLNNGVTHTLVTYFSPENQARKLSYLISTRESVEPNSFAFRASSMSLFTIFL
jgi:hypothetical protein